MARESDTGMTEDDWLQFDEALARGDFDDKLEEFMISKRENAEAGSQFAPPPRAGPPGESL